MTGEHPDRDDLVAFALDALEPGREREIEAHTPGCARCTRELEALVPAVAVLGESVEQLERVEREGDEIVPIGVLAGHQASASLALILSIPRRIRPLIVPRGSLSISAISEWLKPPK